MWCRSRLSFSFEVLVKLWAISTNQPHAHTLLTEVPKTVFGMLWVVVEWVGVWRLLVKPQRGEGWAGVIFVYRPLWK